LTLKSDDAEITRQNKENALKTLEKIKEIDPKDTQNLQVLASMYFNMKQVDKAIEIYNAIIEITPNDIDVLFNVSIAYSNLKQYEKALEMCERILIIEPDNIDALDNSIQFARILKLEDKAVEYSIHLVELDPTAEKIEILCYTLSQAKKWDQLLTFAQRWYELAPDNQSAIQMVLVAAVQTDNKAIKAEFEKKLKALPKK
jgi:tetratricopeptide (TPR) repeat protein